MPLNYNLWIRNVFLSYKLLRHIYAKDFHACIASKFILFWFFYVVSYMPSLSFNYFLSVEFWPKGLLKMCEQKRLCEYVLKLIFCFKSVYYIIEYDSNSNENIQYGRGHCKKDILWEFMRCFINIDFCKKYRLAGFYLHYRDDSRYSWRNL